MNKNTCSETNCTREVLARELCGLHYGRMRRAGTLPTLAKNPAYHYLSEVDVTAKTAVCSICGPTNIRIRPGRGHECGVLRRQKTRMRNARNRTSNPDVMRRYNLRIRFGISVDEYAQMLAAQNGCCAICKSAPSGKRRLAVDHDHETGAIRGLLCGRCNMVLGHMRDDAVAILAASTYLAG